jgi:hypothetical protein
MGGARGRGMASGDIHGRRTEETAAPLCTMFRALVPAPRIRGLVLRWRRTASHGASRERLA